MSKKIPNMVFEMYGSTVYVMYEGTNLGMPAKLWIEQLKKNGIDTTDFEENLKKFKESH